MPMGYSASRGKTVIFYVYFPGAEVTATVTETGTGTEGARVKGIQGGSNHSAFRPSAIAQ